MMRLFISFLFFIKCVPSWSQYEVIKYEFSDKYETDPSYLMLKELQNECIVKVTALRDSIIYCKAFPEQDKLFALQLVNILYDNPEEVVNTMTKNGDLFPWFQVMSQQYIEDLVNEYSSYHYYMKLIKESYSDLRSNIFLKHMKKLPDGINNKLKYLGLDQNIDRSAIFLKGVYSTTSIDQCIKNKDIYFSSLFKNVFHKMEWSQQFYSYQKCKKRKNNYYNVIYTDSNQKAEKRFDYIIEAFPMYSLFYSKRELSMLRSGGRYYVEIDFETEEQYNERSSYFKKRQISDPLQFPQKEVPPIFTRASLDTFITANGLIIESMNDDGKYVKYLFQKV